MDVGIDLGTTFSVVAVEGKVELLPDYPGGPGVYLEDCDVTIIPSESGETTFPSVMIQDPENPSRWLFGSDALQKGEDGFAPVMFSKRKIGTLEEIPVATGTVTAKEVASRFLRYMKECAERALGQTITRAVVTHPAYFDRGAVEETREAARLAGFDMSLPQQMLMEPRAAALAYTRADPRDPLRILTYDLGGGTFDVTYLERIEGVTQIRSFDGNPLLGGYNFDREIVRLVRARLAKKGRTIVLDEAKPTDRGTLARLLRIAENVKIALSKTANDMEAVEFSARNLLVDDKGVPVQVSERITREQFVTAIQPWLDDVLECCRRALVKGKARPEDLHQILMVGGSSRGPWVRDSLKRAFPGAELRLFSPDLCVGAGAAIHARVALPHSANLGEYSLQRGTPETSVLDQVHVSGRFVQTGTGVPPKIPLFVGLKTGLGASRPPVLLAANGGFLFKGVDLLQEGPNNLALSLADDQGRPVTEHAFVVTYTPRAAGQAAPASTTDTGASTVLPRPLYIETAHGMVALAEEGVVLPAKRQASFLRANSNSSMLLKLFQEQDPVGTVRIENIPAEAGVGSPVELTIEVTADNHVRGDVVIYKLAPSRSGETPKRVEALRSPIHVAFEPSAIPTEEELQHQFRELMGRATLLPTMDRARAEEIMPELTPLVERISQSFDQQPFERQEVYVDIRRMRSLLIPPKDTMSPTRREFLGLVGESRETLEDVKTTHVGIREQLASTKAQEIEIGGKKISGQRVEAILSRAASLEKKLAELEPAALEAHAQKDRVAWPRAFERARGLAADVNNLKPPDDRPDISKLPTPLLKMIVSRQEVGDRAKTLQSHTQSLEIKGELGDWLGEIKAIRKELETLQTNVGAIDDTLPSEQALAKVRQLLEPMSALDARIAYLGNPLKKH